MEEPGFKPFSELHRIVEIFNVVMDKEERMYNSTSLIRSFAVSDRAPVRFDRPVFQSKYKVWWHVRDLFIEISESYALPPPP